MQVPIDDTILEDVEMTSLIVVGSEESPNSSSSSRTASNRPTRRGNIHPHGNTMSRMIFDRIINILVRRIQATVLCIIIMIFLIVLSLQSSSKTKSTFINDNNSTNNTTIDNKNNNMMIHQPIPHNNPSLLSIPTPSPSTIRSSTTSSISRSRSHHPTIQPTLTKRPITKEEKIQNQIQKWGKWHFWDNMKDLRPPLSSYIPLYPNGDVPYRKFPPKAWQSDAVYVNHFIDSAVELIQRTKDVLFTEYGHGPKDILSHSEIIKRNLFFKFHSLKTLNSTKTEEEEELLLLPKDWKNTGGWTTERTFLSLSKRLLHCMMTNCEFTIVLGGSNKLRRRMNHKTQEYLYQFQQVMNPIFHRLGITLNCRYMISTSSSILQMALGFTTIYGPDIDMFIWDDDNDDDENNNTTLPELDLLYRQALMTSKAPILVGGSFHLLRLLYIHADADVMALGTASNIWKITESEQQAQDNLPWSMRFVKCTTESTSLCHEPKNKYRTLCNDTEKNKKTDLGGDILMPTQDIGFREHRLKARVLAFALLDAFEDALATWSSLTIMGGHPLRDDYWHIGTYYDNIQSKVKAYKDTSIGSCHQIKDYLIPDRVCTVPMKARTECTPRYEPNILNIRSIIQPDVDGYVPHLTGSTENNTVPINNIPTAWLENPDDVLDVIQIISNRRQLVSTSEWSDRIWVIPDRYLQEEISGNVISKWHVLEGSSREDCDGYIDNIGGIVGDESSGELVLTLDQISEGIVIMVFSVVNTTIPMTPENDGFLIDMNMDGKVKTISNKENVGIFTISDSRNDAGPMNTTIRVQIRNCTLLSCDIMITHIYWS